MSVEINRSRTRNLKCIQILKSQEDCIINWPCCAPNSVRYTRCLYHVLLLFIIAMRTEGLCVLLCKKLSPDSTWHHLLQSVTSTPSLLFTFHGWRTQTRRIISPHGDEQRTWRQRLNSLTHFNLFVFGPEHRGRPQERTERRGGRGGGVEAAASRWPRAGGVSEGGRRVRG